MNEHDYVWLRYDQDYDMLLDMYRFMQVKQAMKLYRRRS